MGNSFTTSPSDALWMPYIPNSNFDFVAEIKPWPIVHSLLPFSITYWFQNSWFTILLFVLNEVVEAFITLFYPQTTNPDLAESVWNVILSDVYFGFIGIAMAELLLYLVNFKTNGEYRNRRVLIPPDLDLYNHFGLYLKYALELLAIQAIVIFFCVYFDDGFLPLGNFIAPFWYALWIYLARYWNTYDRSWKKKRPYSSTKMANTNTSSVSERSQALDELTFAYQSDKQIEIHSIYSSEPWKTQQSERTYWNTYYFVFWAFCSLYAISFIIRWSSTYMMVLIETFIILAIEVALIAFRMYKRAPVYDQYQKQTN